MADVYSSESRGHNLNSIEISNLNLSSSHLRGFFLKSELESLLMKNDCVGIRFYNIEQPGNLPFILAVAAKADGFEINDVFLVSGNVFGNLSMANPNTMNFNQAVSVANVNNSSKFMSFFSKNDLEGILLNGNVEGITLYKTTLNTLDDNDFHPDHRSRIAPIKSSTQTHIAFRTILLNGGIPLSPDINNNLLSLYPCPGHCVSVKMTENTIERNADFIAQVQPTDPYLFEW